MASYQLTEAAQQDVDEIYEYSILNFGLQQARDYLNGLHRCFGTLADNPKLGRDYRRVKAEARRFEYVSWLTDKSQPHYFSSRFLVLKAETGLATHGILLFRCHRGFGVRFTA